MLESFDNNSVVKSALNTDTITVTVNRYSRATPAPTDLEVLLGATKTESIVKITPEFPIVNNLDIMMRQQAGTELSWVTFTEDTETQVHFAPDTSVAPGEYTVVLESFDNNSAVKSALKTDTITVTVTSTPPSF